MPGVVSACQIFPRSSRGTDSLPDFTHDAARSRAFRWGEDGIAGVSDTHGRQNVAFSFWNEKEYDETASSMSNSTDQAHSDFMKERLFGLSNPQGNHGESIKECHFHLDNVPTVSRFLALK